MRSIACSTHEAVDGRQADAKPSRRIRRRTPYALVHLSEEYRMLLWAMQRVLSLARAYPRSDTFLALDAAQSAVLATFADRLDAVYAQLCQVVTPDMLAAMQRERLEFDGEMARYDKQMRRGGQHATTL
jgi:hypothetical protein